MSFSAEKIFTIGKLKLSIYRSSVSSLWRRLKKLEAMEPESEEKTLTYECTKILADIATLPGNNTYLRVKPKKEEELSRQRTLRHNQVWIRR